MPAPASAQPVATFSSPLLASVDRFVSRVEGLFAGPVVENRSLKFADRLLARSLPGGAGLFAPGEAAPLAPAEAAPSSFGRAPSLRAQQLASWGWVLPTPWLPSPAALRGGGAAARPLPTRGPAQTAAGPTPSAARSGAVPPLPASDSAARPASIAPVLPFVAPEQRAPAAVADRARPAVAAAAAGAPAPTPPVAAGASPALEPTETRVRDWLLPTQPQVTEAPASVLPTPMARSFGHLLWSDQRLLRGQSPSESGPAAWASPLSVSSPLSGAALPSLASPTAGSMTAASTIASTTGSATGPTTGPTTGPLGAMSMPMVRAVDLSPPQALQPGARSAIEAAQRRQPGARPALPLTAVPPVVSGAPSIEPSRAVAPAAEAPRVALPSTSGAAAAATPVGAPSERWAADAGAPAGALVPSVQPHLAAVPALSPSLFASPVLSAPAAGGSLLALFASGFTPATSAADRAPGRTAWPSVGGLATHIEHFASSVGGRAAAGSAGLGNPFGGVESWRAAPGVPSVVARSFAEVPAARAGAALSLPFVSAPRAEAAPAARPTLPSALRVAAAAATASPGPQGAAQSASPRSPPSGQRLHRARSPRLRRRLRCSPQGWLRLSRRRRHPGARRAGSRRWPSSLPRASA
ncbi:MAG: hypothetical protein U1A78_28080 [Polyangia bacterium]